MLNSEDANRCEASLVMQRKSLQREDGNEELLTLQQMFDRKIPIEKIRAVIARGNGVPDKDAPGVAKLTAYWIETGRSRLNRNDQSQTCEIRVNAQAAGALDVMGMPLGHAASASAAPSDMEALINAAAQGASPAAGGGLDVFFQKKKLNLPKPHRCSPSKEQGKGEAKGSREESRCEGGTANQRR